jgi:hypothetical protein
MKIIFVKKAMSEHYNEKIAQAVINARNTTRAEVEKEKASEIKEIKAQHKKEIKVKDKELNKKHNELDRKLDEIERLKIIIGEKKKELNRIFAKSKGAIDYLKEQLKLIRREQEVLAVTENDIKELEADFMEIE